MLLPATWQYQVAGVFTSGHADYDQYFIFMAMRDAQRLYGVGDAASAVGIKIKDIQRAQEIKTEVDRATAFQYRTLTWMMDRRNLYQALVTEKTLIGVVLFFLVAMAAFSIASTLIMVVMEKEREIGILKSMGMQPGAIRRVFIIQGFIVGLIGTLIGLFLGLLTASSMDFLLRQVETGVNSFSRDFYDLYQSIFNIPFPQTWELFPAEVYYVTSFPVRIQFLEIFIICLGSVLLTSLCSFIPARQAARLSVTEVLHKE
jgi:lipoprotein-releasing system permease protein